MSNVFIEALIVTTAFILSLFTICKGQNFEIELEASANYPIIPAVSNPVETPVIKPNTGYWTYFGNQGYRENYNEKTGAAVKLNFSFDLTEKFYLKTGVGLNCIRFQRKMEQLNDGSIQEINIDSIAGLPPINMDSIYLMNIRENQDKLGETAILYLEIPLLAGYKLLNGKIHMELGITTSLIAYSVQYKHQPDNNIPFQYNYAIVKDNTSSGLTNLSFSFNTGLLYNFPKTSLFVRYSRQLNPIYDKESQYGGKAKYNLFELGVGYQLR